MPSRKQGKKKSKRTTKSRDSPSGPGNAGDIPKVPKSDLVTASIKVPRANSRLVFHQQAPPVTVSSDVTVTAGNILFSLNSLEGTGTLTALFDFYRIMAVRITIRPDNPAIGVVDPSTTRLVEFYSVIDYNDNSLLTSAANAREYDNCMILFPSETGTRTFQPMMSAPVRSASGTDYMSVKPDWLNTSSDDVLHYGLKYFVPSTLDPQTLRQTWHIAIEYWIEFSKVVG